MLTVEALFFNLEQKFLWRAARLAPAETIGSRSGAEPTALMYTNNFNCRFCRSSLLRIRSSSCPWMAPPPVGGLTYVTRTAASGGIWDVDFVASETSGEVMKLAGKCSRVSV